MPAAPACRPSPWWPACRWKTACAPPPACTWPSWTARGRCHRPHSKATPVLVLIDEIFRGTNHLESVAATARWRTNWPAGAALAGHAPRGAWHRCWAKSCRPCASATTHTARSTLKPGRAGETNGLAMLADYGFAPPPRPRPPGAGLAAGPAGACPASFRGWVNPGYCPLNRPWKCRDTGSFSLRPRSVRCMWPSSTRTAAATCSVVDDDRAVHLPEDLFVQLRQQLLQRRADQRFAVTAGGRRRGCSARRFRSR
jgi:hypothetical protein